jgi:hypothetical protein
MSSLNASFDETIDPESATILSKSIHEMLQLDPSSRPTAATVLDIFSVHGLVTKMQHIQAPPNEEPLINHAHPTEVAGHLPIYRQLPYPERALAAASQIPDLREWSVLFTIINMSRTRIATVSCDADLEYSQVKLWDASHGNDIWCRQYQWSGTHSRADPTFSSDGKYFGVHHGDKALEILDAQSATPVNTIAIQSMGQISAIAISKNAKRTAVAMESGNTPTEGTGLATLNKTGVDLSSNVDVVQTRALSGISLAYDPRGRHLFLVGNSTLIGKRGEYAQGGFCWDIMIRTGAMTFLDESDRTISHWVTPAYNIPFNDFAVFRGLFSDAYSHVGVYNSNKIFGNILNFENYAIFGFNNHSVLVLGNEDRYTIWDGKSPATWITKQHPRPDYSDKTVYKYLLSCEAELNNHKAQLDAKFVAKLEWDNMPPLTDVKGFAETDAGLTLILEGEYLIFFGKEPSTIAP